MLEQRCADALNHAAADLLVDQLRIDDGAAVFRGMNAVVPVDGLSSIEAYADYGTVLTFMSAPQVSAKSTLTRSDMIKFQ